MPKREFPGSCTPISGLSKIILALPFEHDWKAYLSDFKALASLWLKSKMGDYHIRTYGHF